jgi:hypothetical protein
VREDGFRERRKRTRGCLLYVREKMAFLSIWYSLFTAMGRDWRLIAMLIY